MINWSNVNKKLLKIENCIPKKKKQKKKLVKMNYMNHNFTEKKDQKEKPIIQFDNSTF